MKLVATDQEVTIKWFVWSAGEKMRHTKSMRGAWGYDAQCSCGWETKTGGGVRSWIKHEIETHKRFDHNYKWEMSA